MRFSANNSVMFTDTYVPDLFIVNFMPNSDGNFVKVYLYCWFLAKKGADISITDLANKLALDVGKVKEAFAYWEEVGVMLKKGNSFIFTDLKEAEMLKSYKPILADSTVLDSEKARNQERSKVLQGINNSFFQGVMSPSWYTVIDDWFDKYKFDGDVMYSLFKYCFDNKALSKNYILAVADNWFSKGVRSYADLDNYFMAYEKISVVKKKIKKRLGITNRKLTEFEEAYVELWTLTYGFSFEIIDLALKKTTSKSNPNFDYINAILKKWHENNLNSVEAIEEFSVKFKQEQKLKVDNVKSDASVSNKHFNKNQDIDYTKYFSNLN